MTERKKYKSGELQTSVPRHLTDERREFILKKMKEEKERLEKEFALLKSRNKNNL